MSQTSVLAVTAQASPKEYTVEEQSLRVTPTVQLWSASYRCVVWSVAAPQDEISMSQVGHTDATVTSKPLNRDVCVCVRVLN